MPNTRDSGATIEKLPVLDTSSSDMSAIAWPANRLTNWSSIATQSLKATYALWSELIENQQHFTVRLLNAMGASNKAQSRPPQLSTPTLIDSIVDDRDNRVVEGLSSAIPDASRRRRAPSNAGPDSEFPIKRYDTLTVKEISGKLDKLRDRRSVRTVLAYEAKHKARKGVAAAGEARLRNLDS